MTHELSPITHWPAGDTRVLPFVIPDADSGVADARKNLTGATITWQLRDADGTTLLDDTDANVTITVTNAAGGEFEVRVEKEATETISGSFVERIRVTDTNGNRSTWRGRVYITS